MSEPLKKNILTRKEFLRLATWLQSKIEEFKREETPFVKVAEQATMALKITLSDDHIRRALKDLDLSYKPKRAPGSAGSPSQFRQRLVNLEFAFTELCRRLGEPDVAKLLEVRRDIQMTPAGRPEQSNGAPAVPVSAVPDLRQVSIVKR